MFGFDGDLLVKAADLEENGNSGSKVRSVRECRECGDASFGIYSYYFIP